MPDVTIWGAFLAGLISFVSPCILPIVPPYLAFIAGVSLDQLTGAEQDEAERRANAVKVLMAALAFVLGFSTVFVALGASASFLGQLVTSNIRFLGYVGGVIIIVMGLHFLGVFRIALMQREARVHVERKPAGLLGAYLMGLAFAFGWTPCVGPILAAILFVAGAEETVSQGALLLSAYALGIGVPFLLAAGFAGSFMKFMVRFRRHLGLVEKLMGVLLILTGIAFLTGQMATMSYWLLETFPALQLVG